MVISASLWRGPIHPHGGQVHPVPGKDGGDRRDGTRLVVRLENQCMIIPPSLTAKPSTSDTSTRPPPAMRRAGSPIRHPPPPERWSCSGAPLPQVHLLEAPLDAGALSFLVRVAKPHVVRRDAGEPPTRAR